MRSRDPVPGTISEKIIREVIEKGLDSLGQSPKQAVWFCLEKDFGFDREKLPKNLKTLEESLQKVFGLGYKFLETLFMRYLQEAIGQDLHGYGSFAECMKCLYTQERKKQKSLVQEPRSKIDVHDRNNT